MQEVPFFIILRLQVFYPFNLKLALRMWLTAQLTLFGTFYLTFNLKENTAPVKV